MKTLGDYMNNCVLFQRLIQVPHIVPIADKLDTLLQIQYSSRILGSLVKHYVDANDEVSDADQIEIANMVYMLNRERWNTLFEFVDAEVIPWSTGNTLTEVTYGKVVKDEAGGEDSYSRSNTIAGFDSVDLVDDTARSDTTTYGKTDESTQSGKDVIEVTTRNQQAEVLVDYTLQFWQKHGLIRTILRDTSNTLCLPVTSF